MIGHKLALIAESVGVVPKTKSDGGLRYAHQHWDDLQPKIRAALKEHKVSFWFEHAGPPVVTEKEKGAARAIVCLRVTLDDLDDPGKQQSATLYGMADDPAPGDKAIRKAETSAVKSFWLKVLMVPSEEISDPDDDQGQPVKTPEQRLQSLKEAIEKLDSMDLADALENCVRYQNAWARIGDLPDAIKEQGNEWLFKAHDRLAQEVNK